MDSGSGAWMEHYHLDRGCCWSFTRYHFPWATKRRPELREVWVELEQDEVLCSGEPITVKRPGETISLQHPVTGNEYTLKILDLQPETIDEQQLPGGLLCPRHFFKVRYALEPDLPRSEFSLRDCGESDSPVKAEEENRPAAEPDAEAAALGIIGGADGPTAVLFAEAAPDPEGHSDCSSLHFEPAAEVRWKPVFRVRQSEPIRICLG